MAEEYILVRDIVFDHNVRMMNIKKYYPYFKLAESDFSAYQGGRYQGLDMGYILMAVLRFFIEENNFKEKDVTYDEYETFIGKVYGRDFDMSLTEDEKSALSLYIFDKIRNDGKPFTYQYFDPNEKAKKTIRMRIIDSRIKDDVITYYITSDAIEFYLDTKEIKDESTITIAQVLLGKMIESKNFKGGTEVIKRINSEVNRLKMRKNEVLNILGQDVFQGMKAYEDFVNTGIRWFDEEQKLFEKNMELIRESLERTEKEDRSVAAIKDIYELETELKKSILKHSELLSACTELQIQADKMVSDAKYLKLRRSFDFTDALKVTMEEDNTSLMKCLIEPLLKLNIKKTFDIKAIDKMLTLPGEREEKGEVISETEEETPYIYDDEIEDERIEENFELIILTLMEYIKENKEFKLSQFNDYIKGRYGEEILKNGDYYALLVHMCQKNDYNITDILKKPDTFFEEYVCSVIKKNSDKGYENIHFIIEHGSEDTDIIEIDNVAWITDMTFKRQ